MIDAEVLIVGAGPAGATAALNLAPFRRVALADAARGGSRRIGESVPPAVRRLLADMGLLESFEAEGHLPSYGNRAVWGMAAPFTTDFLRDPDGPGWHVDRTRFDVWLRGIAERRGAALLMPASLRALERRGRRFVATLAAPAGRLVVAASYLIDAGGRPAPAGHRLGARRRIDDRLFCRFVYGRDAAAGQACLSTVEAVPDGWWYTAPLPGSQRILAFHTDAGSPAAARIKTRAGLLEHVARTHEVAAVLRAAGFSADVQSPAAAPAHSSVLLPCAGPDWLAVGDAAVAFDPLSSQGLLNALFTGLAAAVIAERALSGQSESWIEYAAVIDQICRNYRINLRHWYRAETRWPWEPFWRKRHEMPCEGGHARAAELDPHGLRFKPFIQVNDILR